MGIAFVYVMWCIRVFRYVVACARISMVMSVQMAMCITLRDTTHTRPRYYLNCTCPCPKTWTLRIYQNQCPTTGLLGPLASIDVARVTMQRNLIRQVAKTAAVFLARFPFQSLFWKFQSATRGTRMAGSKRLWRSSVSPVGMVPRLLVMCVLSCCSACRGQCLARARRAAAQARSHGALRSLVGDIERLSRVLDRANVRSHPAAVAFCSRCGVPTALPSQGATH